MLYGVGVGDGDEGVGNVGGGDGVRERRATYGIRRRDGKCRINADACACKTRCHTRFENITSKNSDCYLNPLYVHYSKVTFAQLCSCTISRNTCFAIHRPTPRD